MRGYRQALVFAAVRALPVFAYSRDSSDPCSECMSQSAQAPNPGSHEANMMKPARALLVKNVDAKQDQSGQTVEAKLEVKSR